MNGVQMLAALGDPMRQQIFQMVVEKPVAVSALAESLPISRPAVSQHLAVLKNAGLVYENAEGTRRLYRADPEAFARLRAYLDSFWARSLEAFGEAVDVGEEVPDEH